MTDLYSLFVPTVLIESIQNWDRSAHEIRQGLAVRSKYSGEAEETIEGCGDGVEFFGSKEDLEYLIDDRSSLVEGEDDDSLMVIRDQFFVKEKITQFIW